MAIPKGMPWISAMLIKNEIALFSILPSAEALQYSSENSACNGAIRGIGDCEGFD